jgi:hypothetical protein
MLVGVAPMILFFEKDPDKYTAMLDDKRLTSTLYYVAIAISDVLHETGTTGPWPKSNATTKPILDWTMRSRGNYKWMINLLECLTDEYEQRFETKSKAQSFLQWFKDNTFRIKEGPQTNFPDPPILDNVYIEDVFSDTEKEHLAILEQIIQQELSPSSWWGHKCD